MLKRGDSTKCRKCARSGSRNGNWNTDRAEVAKNYKVKRIVGQMLHRVLRSKKTERTHKILGYNRKQFMEHIESKFKNGMHWENHGQGNGNWHVDHIKPVSLFLKEGVDDPNIINALNNLQPLWAKENLLKHTKYMPYQLELL